MLPLAACQQDDQGLTIFSQTFDFSTEGDDWTGDFTDYDVQQPDSIFAWTVGRKPIPNKAGQQGLLVTANNSNGDLFLFIKNKITGLMPDANYTVVFEVEAASNIPVGAGAVLKAGASSMEPRKVIENNRYVLNLDKGESSFSTEYAAVLGDVGNYSPTSYPITTIGNGYNGARGFTARTNSKGEIWLFVGVDVMYKEVVEIYYSRISVVFSASE